MLNENPYQYRRAVVAGTVRAIKGFIRYVELLDAYCTIALRVSAYVVSDKQFHINTYLTIKNALKERFKVAKQGVKK